MLNTLNRMSNMYNFIDDPLTLQLFLNQEMTIVFLAINVESQMLAYLEQNPSKYRCLLMVTIRHSILLLRQLRSYLLCFTIYDPILQEP